MRTAAINTSLDSDGLVEVRRILSSEAQIYDLETYQPANSVRQLMYRVRAAHMNALDGVLAKDPDLAPLEISAAQYVVISVCKIQVRGLGLAVVQGPLVRCRGDDSHG